MTADSHHEIRNWLRARRRAYLLDEPAVSEVWLIRHADAYEQQLLLEQEGFEPGLSPVGRLQAQRLGERLRGLNVAAIYCSDLRRAHETATIVGQSLGLIPVTEAGLHEARLSSGEGAEALDVLRTTIAETLQRVAAGQPPLPLDAAEGSEVVATRVSAAIDRILARHASQRVLVVSHGAAILAYLRAVLGLQERLQLYPEYTGISIVRARGDLRQIVSINDSTHLLGLALFDPASD